MAERKFGMSGRLVPVIGQGTWYIEEASRREAVASLRRGIELGLAHIDTAELYGSGRAEEVVAEAIAGLREKVFLVSKVLPQNASRTGAVKACESSLRRLKTDRLDCYLLHWRGSYPLEDTIAAFEDLSRAGKILSWGVSNFDADDLEEALKIAGSGRIACNQVLYHLKERVIEHDVIPWCERERVAVVGYSPFGHRNFPDPSSESGRVLADIAKAHGATSRQAALAFLTRLEGLFTIPKAARLQHTEENAGALDLRLSADEIAAIDAAFPLGSRRRSLPMI
jgi:diketogulonate reductase-like aldo/keto reductase